MRDARLGLRSPNGNPKPKLHEFNRKLGSAVVNEQKDFEKTLLIYLESISHKISYIRASVRLLSLNT